MRKAGLFALMMTLLLTACGGGGEKDSAGQLQQQYAAVAAAEMEADITCHYGGEVREYTLKCSYTPESSAVTVKAPKNLAGISAVVEGGQLQLDYEDISLDAGSASDAALSPVTVLPELMEAAARGYVTEVSEEEREGQRCLRMSCDRTSDLSAVYTTWFHEETMLPLYSEVCLEGEVVYQVVWNSFAVTERTAPEQQEDRPANG